MVAPEIHPNALKHLTRDEVLSAWGNVVKSIQRESDDEPPRWLCVGWLIIHAMSPVQPKFAKEIAQTERRAR